MDKTAKVMEVCKDVGCINRNVTKLLIMAPGPRACQNVHQLTANLSKCDTSPCVDALAREMDTYQNRTQTKYYPQPAILIAKT
jgi:hypothetical protein